jgi:hypothetical protein
MSDAKRELCTQITARPPALCIADFYENSPETPGNVGVALCGGGSRALTAAMGQLRGLEHLTDSEGVSLLSRTRALSTVSGGSWAGLPWIYLPRQAVSPTWVPGPVRWLFGLPGRAFRRLTGRGAGRLTSDADFLGGFVTEPSRLVPTESAGHTLPETLDELPEGNIGGRCKSGFSIIDLAADALYLRLVHDTPPEMLWQVLMARHFLEPYRLYHGARRRLPTSLFSADDATLERDVIGPNPALRSVRAHLARPPFHICNTAMFVSVKGTSQDLLAPVQATPFFTGIVGRPDGVDANERPPGGGGVTSFSFGSELSGVDGSQARVRQQRTWSLTDALGCSSAALAEPLKNKLREWAEDPTKRSQDLRERAEGGLEISSILLSKEDAVRQELSRLLPADTPLQPEIGGILDPLIPAYRYWPVRDIAPESKIKATQFADGGALDNTGVTALLSYADVDSVISFLNSSTRLAEAAHGIADRGPEVEERTRIEVDGMLPSLFGYQPYDATHGYQPYAGDLDPRFPLNAHNQVFDGAAFAELLEGLWAASGSGSYQSPARFEQPLQILQNPWHGIEGGREVRVLWVYLTRVRAWYDALSPRVQDVIGPFDDPSSCAGFPHYSTAHTELTATQINLMAHLTAWCVAGEGNEMSVRSLYEQP